MELELGLALPSHNAPSIMKGNNSSDHGFEIRKDKKRGFLDRPFSLLLWSGQPNEEDDDQPENLRFNGEIVNDEENKDIVGWPPITSLRKELLHTRGHQGVPAPEHVIAVRNSMYVKVKMEGVAIGRKIDLRLFHSYPDLIKTLINMFAKYGEIHKNSAEYTVLYQDKVGDWLLAGDVPWETFIESVQRIEVLWNGHY